MNEFEKWWSDYGHEAYRGFQLEAFKAGMLAAAEIAENLPTCYSGQTRDGADIASKEIKSRAEEL